MSLLVFRIGLLKARSMESSRRALPIGMPVRVPIRETIENTIWSILPSSKNGIGVPQTEIIKMG